MFLYRPPSREYFYKQADLSSYPKNKSQGARRGVSVVLRVSRETPKGLKMGQRGVQHSRFRLGLLLAAKKKVANAIIFLVVLVLIVLQEGFLLAEGRATKHSPSHQ